jgi:hypothetical protein
MWAAASDLYTKCKNEALVVKKLPETLRRATVSLAEIAKDARRTQSSQAQLPPR